MAVASHVFSSGLAAVDCVEVGVVPALLYANRQETADGGVGRLQVHGHLVGCCNVNTADRTSSFI